MRLVVSSSQVLRAIRFKRFVVQVAGLLLLLGAAVSSARAQSDLKADAPCGTYRVALYEYGSLYFQGPDGKYQGIDKDVVDELARRTGCKFETFLDSRVRTWIDLAKGRLDMTVSGIKTPQREVFAVFVPYLKSHNLLLVRNDVRPAVQSIADFVQNKNLRLAVVKSFQHGGDMDELVDALKQQGRVDEYADAQIVARVVALDRAQAFISEPVAWQPLLAENKLQNRLIYLESNQRDDYVAGLVLSRTRVTARDVEKIRAAMEALRDDGTLLKIYRKYVAPDIASSVLP